MYVRSQDVDHTPRIIRAMRVFEVNLSWQMSSAAGQNRHSAGKSEAVVYIERTNRRLF